MKQNVNILNREYEHNLITNTQYNYIYVGNML